MSTPPVASPTPIEPVDDFGEHHAVLHLLLAVDALGANVERLAEGPVAESHPEPDDFVFALAGLAALRSHVRSIAAVTA